MGEGRFQVILSPRSLDDLEKIVAYIAADNPQAAERFGQRLISEAEAIGSHPFAGRMVPEFDDPLIRERIHRFYRIVYRVDERRRVIVVSRFWHAARGTPEAVPNSE
jgi:plasmid stabilization system protein ParE